MRIYKDQRPEDNAMSAQVNKRNIEISTVILSLMTTIVPFASYAAGFAVNEQSITYLGNAYAGTSSAVQDASTSYYNPAGISLFGKSQVVLSGAYSYPSIKLTATSAQDSAANPVTGVNPSKPNGNLFIPGFNSAYQINRSFAVGLSVVEIFATDLKYEADSIARYMSTTTKISTIDISPSISYKVHKKFYVGAALDFVKFNVNLSSSVAWGNVGQEALGYVNNTMNGWATGFHVGVIYKPSQKVKMGLVYFSRFTPKLSGGTSSDQTLDFGTPTEVSSSFSLPDRINTSVTYVFTSKFKGMAELAWTHWSRLKTMQLNYNSTALPGTLVFNFKNSWRVAFGGDYNFTPAFALKAGLSYDQTPVNNNYRTVRLPENNRYNAALGLTYVINKRFSVVAAYSHAFMKSFDITETAATESLNSSPNVANERSLSGKFNTSSNIFGLQVVFSFGKSY